MRIAIDCRLWHEGGVGRYVRNLVHYLPQFDQKHDYTLFFLNKIPPSLDRRFHRVTTSAYWHSLAEQRLFLAELNQGRFDLVHFPYFSHPILYRRPFVMTVHDLTILHHPTGKATTKNPLWYWIKRLGYTLTQAHGVRSAKQIMVPTEFVKKDLLATYRLDKNKVTVTNEGVGYEMTTAREEPVSQVEGTYWLYVGNFYPHKNVEYLLRSFARLESQNGSLVLCGPDDFFAKRIRREANRLRLDRRLLFLPSVTEGQLRWLYHRAKGLVLPSLFEGFGLPVVEAAYHGCPLMLSDIPVFREIAPLNSVFFDPKNPASLIEAMAKPIKKPNAGEGYFRKFSFAKMTKETLAVYGRAL